MKRLRNQAAPPRLVDRASRHLGRTTLWCAAIALTLCACSPQREKPDADPDKPNPGSDVSLHRNRQIDPLHFVADREVDPTTGESKPLTGYTLSMEALLDKTDTFRPRAGRLVGEGIIFGLPRTSGDTGPHYNTALKRAAEIFTNSPDEAKVTTEVVEEGTIALVRFESLGFPAARAAGEDLPIIITPLGNATSVIGGHIYSTSLRCDRSREVLAAHSYGHFRAEDVEPYHVILRRPWDFDDVLDPKNVAGDPPTAEPGASPSTENVVARPDGSELETRFLLRRGFRLLRRTTWDEVGRDEIRLTVGGFRYDQDGNPVPGAPVDPEIIEAVERTLRDPALKMRVERDPLHPSRLLIVPSIRKYTIEEFYNRLRILSVRVQPRRMAHIIADNNNGRIIIAGPSEYRKLSGTLRFQAAPPDTSGAFVSSGFRIFAEPVNERRSLRVTWGQPTKDGKSVRNGEDVVENDLGTLIRYAYSNGCGADDCFLMIEQAKNARLINAQLSLFPARIKPKVLGE